MNKEFRLLRNGGYDAIHAWLRLHFGKADRCEETTCKKISKTFQWALRPEKSYTHIRENFIRLCASCHRLQDQKPEWIEKARQKRIGKKLSLSWRKAISKACKGIHKGNKHSSKSVRQLSLDGKVIKDWLCINDAAKKLDLSPSGITMCARGQLKKSGGFRWSYLLKSVA